MQRSLLASLLLSGCLAGEIGGVSLAEDDLAPLSDDTCACDPCDPGCDCATDCVIGWDCDTSDLCNADCDCDDDCTTDSCACDTTDSCESSCDCDTDCTNPPPTGFVLGMPIDCNVGVDCAILNYVDLDGTSARADYACGRRSYDRHKGTDFAIGDELDMAVGVRVLAAAPGTVTAKRDEMDDINLNDVDPATIQGRECGNGIFLEHSDGWVTKYCHMRLGSILVDVGDTVAEGDAIGMVGLSGSTEFPHLHFGVTLDDEVVDPFVGTGPAGCDDTSGSLWRPAVLATLPYEPAIVNFGFADGAVDNYAIFAGGLADGMNVTSPALVFYAQVLGIQAGDQIEITILDPAGDVFVELGPEPASQAWVTFVQYAGKSLTSVWQSGEYSGEVTLTTSSQSIVRAATLQL